MSYEQPVSCLAAAASASSSAPATTVPVARACDAKPLRARGRLRGALPGAGLALLASAMLVPGLAAADTLDTVRERGVVVCGTRAPGHAASELAWALLLIAALHPTTQPWYFTWGLLLMAAATAASRRRPPRRRGQHSEARGGGWTISEAAPVWS